MGFIISQREVCLYGGGKVWLYTPMWLTRGEPCMGRIAHNTNKQKTKKTCQYSERNVPFQYLFALCLLYFQKGGGLHPQQYSMQAGDDPDFLSPLTPNMLLTGRANAELLGRNYDKPL